MTWLHSTMVPISVISGAGHSRLRKSLLNPIRQDTSKAWFIIHLLIRQTICHQVIALQVFGSHLHLRRKTDPRILITPAL